MSQWKMDDSAANSVNWAVAQVKVTPNTANRDAFYGNVTSNAFITNAKVGQFAVDSNEIAANPAVSHTGWAIRTEGTGGRAGRVQFETLVAGGITSDGSDDTTIPDYAIRILTQPSSRSANSTNNQIATFSVSAVTAPTGGTISYVWQKWNGSAFANLSNAGAYSNTTTATLSVLANTASNAEIYRAYLTSTGGAVAVASSNAVITITT